MILLLVAAFILSGAAGLIYESIWTRYLGLFVGHSAYAQIIVLVIFLGGMSLGAQLTGARSRRIKSPLVWYAGIEFVVGLLALAFHDVFTATTSFAYASIFPATSGVVLTVAKWSLAGLLILPQSILLGATFPLMSAGAIRLSRDPRGPGRMLSLLYFANSLGAAAGVLLAGFSLIQAVGIDGTLMVAAFINIVVAIVVGLAARNHERSVVASGTMEAEAPPAESPDRGPYWRVLLAVSFGTAVASFIYEIAWIRMLSLVIGSATHSFELMLSAFIFGLALGALWVRRRADAVANPVRFLGVVQWVMGLAAVSTLPLYVASFDWVAALINTVEANDNGYLVFIIARYLIAALIMLPATFCAGMTLPLITRVLMRGGAGERAIGTVYSVNTLGSIVGVILAGLVLMPLLGLKLLLIAGALVDIGLGVWLVSRESGSPQPAGAGRLGALPGAAIAVSLALTAGFIGVISLTAKFDLPRLTSGVYRHGVVADASDYTVPFYKDGRTASVSLRKSTDGFVTLATNGKPDASMDQAWLKGVDRPGELFQLTRDLATQLLLPIVTLAHVPAAENVAVIGFGSGMSTHLLLGSPRIKEVVTIEIEPEMVNASRGFRPANARAYEDKRSTFVIDDAKSYFASSGRKFDLILSEPSNPWVSGVSGLFTVEFYERVKTQLSENGVFGQWLHLYELSDGLATSVLFAIDSAFKDYSVFYTSNADILIVASNKKLPEAAWEQVAGYPGIAKDLGRAVPLTVEQFEALRLGDRSTLSPMIQIHGAANSDYVPVLDLGAERTRFLRENADGYTGLSEGRFDVIAALSGRKQGFGRSGVSPTPEIPRSAALAVGATLRAMRTLDPRVSVNIHQTAETRAAVYRLDQLMRMAGSMKAPTDWHRWVEHIIASDAELHSGTAGVVDSSFFVTLRRYVAGTGAPAEARAAVDFLHGLGTWNWPEVIASANVLETSRDSLGWVPDVLLRNATVVAHIKLKHYDAARGSLQVFAQRTNDDHFREQILSSYLIYADSTLKARLEAKP